MLLITQQPGYANLTTLWLGYAITELRVRSSPTKILNFLSNEQTPEKSMSDIAANSFNLPDSGSQNTKNRSYLLPMLLLLGVWMVVSSALLINNFENLESGKMLGNDDAMRLVEVRDYLAGQGWYDNLQRRLSPPEGVPMHWSRLVDAPLAGMISLFETFTSRSFAEKLTLIIWPLTLLLGAIGISGTIAARLGGRGAMIAAFVIAPLTVVALTQFMPGRIDHHNLQIVLTMALLALMVCARTSNIAAALAGLTIAVMLAIGLESLPYMLLAPATLALCWIAVGPALSRTMVVFGLSMGVAVIAIFFATVPPGQYGAVRCDAISIPYVAAFVLGGLGLAALGLTSGAKFAATLPGRCVAAALVAGAIGGAVIYAYPECLSGPYGNIDPRLIDLWLSQVSEAQSVFDLGSNTPDRVLAYFGFPVSALAIGICAWRTGPADRRIEWAFVNVFLLGGILIACWQIRGLTFANFLAVPASAWLLAQVYDRVSIEPDAARRFLRVLVAGLLLNNVFYIGIADAIAATLPGSERDRSTADACLAPAALAPLRDLPTGVILSGIDLGAHILVQTSHSVMSAPYHRNQRGNLLAMDVMMAQPEDARELIAASDVDYILYCDGMADSRTITERAPDGLLARLQSGQGFSWLTPVSLGDGSSLHLFRVEYPTNPPGTGENLDNRTPDKVAANPGFINVSWQSYSHSANRLLSLASSNNRQRGGDEQKPRTEPASDTVGNRGTRGNSDNQFSKRLSSPGTTGQTAVRQRVPSRKPAAGSQRVLLKGMPGGSGSTPGRRPVSSGDAPGTKPCLGSSGSCGAAAAAGGDRKPGSGLAGPANRRHVAAARRADADGARKPSGRAGRRRVDDAGATPAVLGGGAKLGERGVDALGGRENRRSDNFQLRSDYRAAGGGDGAPGRTHIRQSADQAGAVRSSRQRPRLAQKNQAVVRPPVSLPRPADVSARSKRLQGPGSATPGRRMRSVPRLVVYGCTLHPGAGATPATKTSDPSRRPAPGMHDGLQHRIDNNANGAPARQDCIKPGAPQAG
jgi:hypothetical protein